VTNLPISEAIILSCGREEYRTRPHANSRPQKIRVREAAAEIELDGGRKKTTERSRVDNLKNGAAENSLVESGGYRGMFRARSAQDPGESTGELANKLTRA